MGMYYSVMCAEDSNFTAEDQLLDGVNPLLASALDASEFLETCDLWDVQPLPSFTDDPLVSDVPVLVLSGGFDPITPPAWGELVADNLARQLEQRVAFRRAIKKSVASSMRMGAEGIRIECAGRIGGSEMCRRERSEPAGRVPLHTLRADIDYAQATAFTMSGTRSAPAS